MEESERKGTGTDTLTRMTRYALTDMEIFVADRERKNRRRSMPESINTVNAAPIRVIFT